MNNLHDILLSKSGKITIELAKMFLSMEVGDKILAIDKMSEKYDIARGTIQLALKKIKLSDSIKFESRGRLGTFIIYIIIRNFGKYLE